MKKYLLQGKGGQWLLCYFPLWLACLLITGCSSQLPAPTLLPTLTHTPIPSPTPLPTPTVVIPTDTPSIAWRTATLENLQSFDFRQETVGTPTQGDLYFIAFGSHQSSSCFWANNVQQVGGRDLGSWSQTALREQTLPRDRYSGECMPVIGGHAYVYGLSGDERLVVLRVVSTGSDSVTIEYILRK